MATPGPAPHFDKGPPPDLSARFKLKSKYAELQRKYTRALATRQDLTLEASEKEAKVQRLQDEVDLVIDQIYDTDYAHLMPKKGSLRALGFDSDNSDAEEHPGSESAARKGKGKERLNGTVSTDATSTNGNGSETVNGAPSGRNGSVERKGEVEEAVSTLGVRKDRPSSPNGVNGSSPAHKRPRVDATDALSGTANPVS